MKLVPALLVGLVTLAAPTSAARVSPKARLAALLEGRVAGAPVNCISLATVRSSQIIDGQAILYRAGGDTLYLNRPRQGADGLDQETILVTRTPSTSLCSLETVRLVDRTSGIQRGFVGLGEFVPYSRAEPR